MGLNESRNFKGLYPLISAYLPSPRLKNWSTAYPEASNPFQHGDQNCKANHSTSAKVVERVTEDFSGMGHMASIF